MMVTFLYILINITHPELKGEAIACSMGLFIFYTWRRILLILITAAIAFALVFFFPFLAPVAFILMVIIFIARLSYILKTGGPCWQDSTCMPWPSGLLSMVLYLED